MAEEEEQVSSTTEKSKSKNKLILIIGVVIIVVLLAGGFFYFVNSKNSNTASENISPVPTQTPQKIEVTFNCADDKSIIAIFNNDTDGSVDLALSDGTTMNLPRAESGSGARYANDNESTVFWNQGNEAFLEENGEQTYTDCVTAPSS